MDYTGGYDYRPIENFSNTPDDFAGTTKDGVNPNSHHVVTGWGVDA